jgi:hypothetical protein
MAGKPQSDARERTTDVKKPDRTVRQKAEEEELEEARPGNPESFTREELQRFEDDVMREHDA